MTTAEFIEKAKAVHGDKYNYSKVEYVNPNTKVCIICLEHGEFWTNPRNHMKGFGVCPKCSRRRILTTEEFIAKAKEIHGDKYDYSKTEYINNHTKVCVIDKNGKEIWQLPTSHLKGFNPMAFMTTEEFISRAKEVHGDKYDYSKVEYVNAQTKVCIVCPKHGEFWQTPSKHLIGRGCPKCGGSVQLTTEEFIRRAKEIHGDKYDYSKTKYINANTKVCIICPKHGEFWMLPSNHTSKTRPQGCHKCTAESPNPKRLTTEEFIRRAKEIHGDKYDYSKVEYVDNRTKVCIICPTHGEFWQQPNNHLMGNGCPKCIGKGLTQEEFISEARKVHGDKYDYSKIEYKTKKDKICIICPEHGEFWQIGQSHLAGHGCPKCALEKARETQRLSKEEFIKKAREIHGDKYDYSKVEYVNSQTKVCIICPEHGEFWQVPNAHLGGCGCPKCAGKITITTEEFIRRAKEIHGDKYDYSKVEYVNAQTKVCIICLEHGEFWTTPNNHLQGKGCPNCKGLRKQYKFNLLQEFESEYEFKSFLANNDVNILYVILRNIEPKFEPLKRDIEKALAHSNEVDPIKALRDKYTSDSEDELDEDEEEVGSNETEDFEITTAPSIDLDDDDAIDSMVTTETTKEVDAPTIEDIVKNTQREIKVINKIEHMLTPEDREYIMQKFLNDKRRIWMTARENKK